MPNLDFNNIRPIKGTANEGFEEFVCQLARREGIPCRRKFVRNGKPDGGVECYWILEDGSIVAWQAKYFCNSFSDSQYQQIDGSVKEALNTYPNLRRYIIAGNLSALWRVLHSLQSISGSEKPPTWPEATQTWGFIKMALSKPTL